MKGKKDVSKLVKKVVRTKDDRMMTVWVKPEQEIKQGRSLIEIILSFFGFKTKDELKEKVRNDYEKHEIEKKFGVDINTYAEHVIDYFRRKKLWENYFEHMEGQPLPERGTQAKVEKLKEKKKKKKKGGEKKEKIKYNIELMKFIHNLYGGKHEVEHKPIEQQASSARSESVERRIHGTSTPEQPYRDYGILVAREKETQRPTANYVPENIAGTLRPHQADFVNLAIEKYEDSERGVINMDGTGAGKTRQELALAITYMRKYQKPAVIVTENERIFENAFKGDAKAMGINVKLLSPDDVINPEENTVYVTLYHRLKTDARKPHIQDGLVILDESHSVKNKDSEKSKVTAGAIELAKNVALFSATPVDKAEHFYYISRSLGLSNKRMMEKLGYRYVEKRFGGRTVGMYEPTETNEEIANRISAVFDDLTRKGLAVKREVSLDNLEMKIKRVDLSEEQQQRYEGLYADFLADVRNAMPQERGLKKAAGLMKLRRFLEEMKTQKAIEAIDQGLKENKQIVIFATRINEMEGEGDEYSVGTLKEISRILEEKGIKHSNVFASNPKNQELIKKFQDGEHKVILTTPQSGGTGINLDDSTGNSPRKAIILTPPFSAMDMIQQIGRINRLTTKSKAEAEMLVTATEVDAWNTNIIAQKVEKLGATVSGDYAKIDIDEMKAVEFLPEEKAREITKDKTGQVAYSEPRNINIDELRIKPKPGQVYDKVPMPLRNISAYKSFVPVKKDGSVDYDINFPDAEINFGKYSGKTLSYIQEKDMDYFRWMMKEAGMLTPSKIKINKIEKALRMMLIRGNDRVYIQAYIKRATVK